MRFLIIYQDGRSLILTAKDQKEARQIASKEGSVHALHTYWSKDMK